MGCDIHYVVEKNVKGKWLGIFKDSPQNGFAKERDYDFFAEIANVRGQSTLNHYPKFLPTDIGELALYQILECGTDGHSHSHMSIKEFSEIALKVKNSRFKTEYDIKYPWELLFGNPYFLNTDDDKIEDYRIVFWFDN